MIVFCAFCGKKIEYNPERFASGKTGEPVCDECREQEEQVTADD